MQKKGAEPRTAAVAWLETGAAPGSGEVAGGRAGAGAGVEA